MIGGRVYHCLERVQLHRDWLEGELTKEVENGRLFRLLAKLGTITERPESALLLLVGVLLYLVQIRWGPSME